MLTLLSVLLAVGIQEHTSARMVLKINPNKIHAVPLIKRSIDSDKKSVAFSANFSMSGKPIGSYIFDQKAQESFALKFPRPILNFKKNISKLQYSNDLSNLQMTIPASCDTTIQAGPILIVPFIGRDGTLKGDSFLGVNAGQFLEDVFRKTAHTGIGVNNKGDLIVAYDSYINLTDLTIVLQRNGAIWAMNTDGGSAAYLELSKSLYKTLSDEKLPFKYGSALCGIELNINPNQ